MNEQTREQLSALLDNEVTAEELDSLLPELSGNHELRRKAQQWNLIGDALRSSAATTTTQKTTAPDNVIRPNISRWQRVVKPLSGIAVAAGVAAVAVLVGQQVGGDAQQPGNTITVSATPTSNTSQPVFTAAQRGSVMAASSTPRGSDGISALELARQARVSNTMNDFTVYEPITREELLQLQLPTEEQPASQ